MIERHSYRNPLSARREKIEGVEKDERESERIEENNVDMKFFLRKVKYRISRSSAASQLLAPHPLLVYQLIPTSNFIINYEYLGT